jgi:arginine exporter protein ArgO
MAFGLGIGGAIADSVHAGLAFIGVGRLVTAKPEVVRVLAIIAAIVIVAYAVFAWRRRAPERAGSSTPVTESTAKLGILSGIALTLPNPAALSAWVAVAAALWPHATIAEGLTTAVCVLIGSALWFTALGKIIARVPKDHRTLRVVPKIALVVLLASVVVGIARVL